MDQIDVDLEQLSRLARQAGGDMKVLAEITKSYGASAHVSRVNVTLQQARDLLKAAGNNANIVKAALQGSGVHGRDLSMLMGRLQADIDKSRRKALEFESVWTRIFSPRSVWYANNAMGAIQKGFQGLQTVMGGPLNMANNVINRGINMGQGLMDSVIEAAEFRQNALTGMSYMLGGDMNKARELFADAQKLAQKTPLDTNKVIQGIKTFLTSGFSAQESKYLYRVVADQAAKFLDQPEVEQSVISAFTRLQGRGYATAEDLESFRVAKFKNSDIIKQLSQQEGMSALFTDKNKLTGKETEEEAGKKIRAVISTGKVSRYTMLNAAIASLYQGKDLDSAGKLAEEFGGKSLTGAISNAKNAFGDLLASMDLVNGKGFKALMGFFTRYSDLLSNAEGPGKRLRETIQSLVDEFLVGFNLLDEKKMASMIDTAASMGKVVIKLFSEAWGWLDRIINAEPGEFIDSIRDVLIDVGSLIGQGILKGTKEAALGAAGLLSDRKFIEKYGAKQDTIEDLARAHGAYSEQQHKVFKKKYLEAEKAFRAEGQVGTVNRQKGEGVGEAYSRRVAEYAAETGRGLGISDTVETGGLAYGGERPTLDVPSSVPSFASGGTVGGSGPIGSPQLVIAHKGEHFHGVNGNNTGMGSVNVNITVMGPVNDPDALAAALRPMIAAEMRTVFERLAGEG